MVENKVTDWYIRQAKKLDKKYYSKGESIYVLHRRTLMTVKSIMDLIDNISVDDLSLELYMLVKDKNFGKFVDRYRYVLEMAKEKPDLFAEQLYDFYVKMAATIKKDNYYLPFFEFVSFFQNNDDISHMNEKQKYVYRAYVNLLLNQMEFLRKNKFDLNKMVAGVTTDGELIEVEDICPSLDFCTHEAEHIALSSPSMMKEDTLRKIYARHGYKVDSIEDAEALRIKQQLHTNIVSYLTPFINEYTKDIIPQTGFNPILGEYLNEVPVMLRTSDICKEALCHRRKTLSVNGLKVHFDNSTFIKDVLLKEIYHNGAIICLYRLETTQGETSGLYNTQTKQFVSIFTHAYTKQNAEAEEEQGGEGQKYLNRLESCIEGTILWCYAAFVSENILSTSYREYFRDPSAEVTFTSIGGKLRIPTEIKHIRSIAGNDRYETEIKYINGYIRKLPDGQKASEKAVLLAQSLGYDLADNETYVQPFERSSWIVKQP